MRKAMYVLLTSLILCACQEAGQMPITEFSSDDLREGDLLVDVRTPGEYQGGHLDGALNIDWMSGEFLKAWDTIDRDRKVYVYCKVGGRSAEAARVLDSLGYDVVDLTGGWDAYMAREKP